MLSIIVTDRRGENKYASGRRNEMRINISITDSWDFPVRLIAELTSSLDPLYHPRT